MNERVCIGCGCTDEDACDPPCSWAHVDGDVGACDAPGCAKARKRFAGGDRALSRRAKSAVRMRAEFRGEQ